METHEKAGPAGSEEKYLLRLYIAGLSHRSERAINNVKEVCEKYLEDHYELEVIDIYKRPVLAAGEQIVAVPTLVKILPEPLKRIIGDMVNEEKLLFGLDIKKKDY